MLSSGIKLDPSPLKEPSGPICEGAGRLKVDMPSMCVVGGSYPTRCKGGVSGDVQPQKNAMRVSITLMRDGRRVRESEQGLTLVFLKITADCGSPGCGSFAGALHVRKRQRAKGRWLMSCSGGSRGVCSGPPRKTCADWGMCWRCDTDGRRAHCEVRK